MLMLLGYLMIGTFMVLIMTKRVSALVALVLVPVVFGLIAGHGADLGEMVVGGVTKLAPTATTLLFAVLYFAVMIDAGLFDPLVNTVLRLAGDDPVKVTVGSAIVAALVSLDGDGATSALITVTAFLPVYRRLGINPLILATLLGLAGTISNLTPWGGPTARVAAALHLDLSDVFVPLIPTLVIGLVSTVLIAWYLGRQERKRLAFQQTQIEETSSGMAFERDMSLARPKLFWVNLALTLLVFVAVIGQLAALPLIFMIGFAIALTINYPQLDIQRGRLQAYAANALPITVLILAAGIFTGILAGSGMTDAMAQGVMTIVPAQLGPYLGVITGFLSAPLTFALSNDAYYFGVVPVIAETASHYNVAPEVIARASLLAMPIHGLSPLVAALYLVAGLIGRDVAALQRFGLKWAALATLILIATATLTGAIH
jgi:CitMHS family citrate-Mg2+:H+ or citrate-Ca2+:H+ symporter